MGITRAGAAGPWATTNGDVSHRDSGVCCDLLGEEEARYPGLDQVMLHWPEGIPAREFMDQLCGFARDVMPAFAAR